MHNLMNYDWRTVALSMLKTAALITAVLSSPLASASATTASPAAEGEFDTLIARADQEREAGEYANSARSYSAAHRALPAADRVGLMGEITLDNALADYRLAHKQQPASLALLEEPMVLLEEYIAARSKASAEGKAEAVPERLMTELNELRGQLAESEPESEPEPEPEPEPISQPSEPLPPSSAPPKDLSNDSPNDRKVDAAILGTGLASLVGGTALIAGGAWNFSQTESRGSERLKALEAGEFTDEARADYRANLADWQDQWRGTATGLVVSGSVLAAAGIGLTAWGIVRMRKHGGAGRRASLGVPMVSRRQIGATVKIDF